MEPLTAELPRALRRWSVSDPVLARHARRHPPEPRPAWRGSAFEALAVSITHQQVSLAAGRTIWSRVARACAPRVTPARVLTAGPARLRAAGLSRQKTSYVLDLARRVERGEVSLRRFANAPDEDVVASLTEVDGIGPWTAKMFLLFHMRRPDVLAPEDLGLQIAASDLYGVPKARAREFLEGKRPDWTPFSSLASLVLWDSRRRATAQKP